jgi:hypothetical protein
MQTFPPHAVDVATDRPVTDRTRLSRGQAEVALCIEAGDRESPLRPLADSITSLRAMDEIQQQCGIRFREA